MLRVRTQGMEIVTINSDLLNQPIQINMPPVMARKLALALICAADHIQQTPADLNISVADMELPRGN